MAIIRLILANSPAKPLTRPVEKRWQPALFESAKLERAYFPFRGLPHSTVIHIVAFTIVYFFASFPRFVPKEPAPKEKIVMIDLNDPTSMMFLPMFDGGNPQASTPAKPAPGGQSRIAKPAAKPVEAPKPEPVAASNPEPAPPEPPSTTTQGFSYPGPQPIISDVEQPTNRFQTILQPDIENPPILKPPLAIPNIVQLANANKVPQMVEPPPPPEPDEPQPEKAAPKPAEPPKPEPKPPVTPKPEPKPPEPAPKPVATPKPEPKPP